MSSKKPNLFIVGAPRCGTTSMYTYLKQHPDIFMSSDKEIHYFGQEYKRNSGMTAKDYAAHFSDRKDEKYAGEASVMYLFSKSAANELKVYNPSARIIILLRDPVAFLHSYHSQLLGIGYEDITEFEEALEAESDRRHGKRLPWLLRKYGIQDMLYYYDMAAFTDQVQRYFDAFGRESVHVILLDDLKADPARVYRETLNFLGVDTDFKPDFQVINRVHTKARYPALLPVLLTAEKYALRRNLLSRAFGKLFYWPLWRWNRQKMIRPPMSDQLRKRLKAEFVPEVEKLSELLGRDLRYWSNTDIR